MLVRERPDFTGAAAVYPYSDELRRLFAWEDRFGGEYWACRREGDKILLPREACPMGREDRRVDGCTIRTNCTFQARDGDQARVVEDSTERLLAGRSHIIQATTGSGKTAMAMQLIANVGRKTLVIVPKTDLIRGTLESPQWWEHIRDMLGIPEERIGIIQQNRCEVVGKDVVIGMLHSLSIPNRYPASIRRQFGLVIIDEVHRVAADEFSNVCFMFPARLRLGLSATPNRKDGRSQLIKAHIGPIGPIIDKVPVRPKVLRYWTDWLVPRNSQGKKIPHSKMKDGHILKILTRNRRRNALLVHLIGACHLKGRNLVVFSHRLEHLSLLRDAAVKAGIPGTDMGSYVGGRKPAELERAAKKPIVFATYQMVKEGTNCPWWDACLLATPKSDVEQVVGRILRKAEGKKQPAIIDLVDDDSWVYSDYAEARDKFYKSKRMGADIISLPLPEL